MLSVCINSFLLQALPEEKRRLQVHQDRLVEQAEKTLLSSFKVCSLQSTPIFNPNGGRSFVLLLSQLAALQRPNGYNTEGVAIKMLFADPMVIALFCCHLCS